MTFLWVLSFLFLYGVTQVRTAEPDELGRREKDRLIADLKRDLAKSQDDLAVTESLLLQKNVTDDLKFRLKEKSDYINRLKDEKERYLWELSTLRKEKDALLDKVDELKQTLLAEREDLAEQFIRQDEQYNRKLSEKDVSLQRQEDLINVQNDQIEILSTKYSLLLEDLEQFSEIAEFLETKKKEMVANESEMKLRLEKRGERLKELRASKEHLKTKLKNIYSQLAITVDQKEALEQDFTVLKKKFSETQAALSQTLANQDLSENERIQKLQERLKAQESLVQKKNVFVDDLLKIQQDLKNTIILLKQDGESLRVTLKDLNQEIIRNRMEAKKTKNRFEEDLQLKELSLSEKNTKLQETITSMIKQHEKDITALEKRLEERDQTIATLHEDAETQAIKKSKKYYETLRKKLDKQIKELRIKEDEISSLLLEKAALERDLKRLKKADHRQ